MSIEVKKTPQLSKAEFLSFRNRMAKDSIEDWNQVAELRESFESYPEALIQSIGIKSHQEARERSVEVCRRIFEYMGENLNFSEIEAGHGLGHLIRDIQHASVLSLDETRDPNHLYIGLAAGMLHDLLGCLLMDRFDEKHKSVRHGEAGALFIQEIAGVVGLSDAETKAIAYAIAAHTNYRREFTITYDDRESQTTKPYLDNLDGQSIDAVNLVRQIDRLDVNGAMYLARHFLTLSEEHFDFDGDKQAFFDAGFAKQTRLLLRSREEIGDDSTTALEHLRMFAESQTSESVYGMFDGPQMIRIRDMYRTYLQDILATNFQVEGELNKQDKKTIEEWFEFLYRESEPSEAGMKASKVLQSKFEQLDTQTQKGWVQLFRISMDKYEEQLKIKDILIANKAQETTPFLKLIELLEKHTPNPTAKGYIKRTLKKIKGILSWNK